MANFGAKILNNAVSALRAQQAVIANVGNNIANVNTPGYTRRVLNLQTAESSRESNGLSIGNGVAIGNLQRISDTFLQGLTQQASSDKSYNQVTNDFLSRIENVFSLTDDSNTIGSTLTAFFTAVNDLTTEPSSIELRANVIQSANDLVNTISTTYNYLASLQNEADQRIQTELQTVNSITTQIANLNQKIATLEVGNNGSVAADERDQRDQLLESLAEKIGFNQVEMPDGTVSVSLANGASLVNGFNSHDLEYTTNPSFSGGALPPSLSGGVLGYIVTDSSSGAGTDQIDQTQVLQAGGGTIGGYLKMRGYADPTNTNAFEANGIIVDVAARVEAISRSLLTDVNLSYLGPDRNTGTTYWDPSSADLNGNLPSAFGLFDFNYGGAKDRGSGATPAVPDGKPTSSDLDFLLNNGSVKNFSSLLKVTFSDPRSFAAALDAATFPASAQFSTGDGRNAENLAALQKSQINFSAGNFTLTATYGEAYNQLVGYVGNLKAASDVSNKVATDNYSAAVNRRDQVSAVSLDEEFTNLITDQKAYQASARMIKVADEMLQEIVQLI